ncbi:MAG: ParB N-terminal domain-containing protein [Solirubrobacteraceae bacterium]
MSDVDKYQQAQEEAAQRREEAAGVERERRLAELRSAPVAGTAGKPHRIVEAKLDQVSTMINMRSGDLCDIHELAISILETGLRHPPLVRTTDNEQQPYEYEVMAGRRRLAAMGMVDSVSEQPRTWRFDCIDGVSKREALTMQFAENFHQAKPEPIQFARTVRAIMREDPELTAADVSRLVGAPAAWTQKALRMLNLPEEIVERIESGDLSFTNADFVRRGIAKGAISEAEATELVEKHVSGQLSSTELKFGAGYVPPPPPDYEERSSALDEARWAAERGENNDAYSEEDKRDGWDKEKLQDEPSYSSNVTNRERQRGHEGEQEVSHAQLDAYLLGRVLARMAPQPLLADLGIDRDRVYLWAQKLPDADRLGRLRQVALAMLAVDPEPPLEIFGQQTAQAA